MSDLQQYITNRKMCDSEFLENYEIGYDEFKIGAMLQAMRKDAGLTQDEIAKLMKTKKSAISRIENHAEDIRLSTLFKIASIFGKHVKVSFV
jgi:HTH-type transcriptional regulator / antitoxin HipB